MKPPGHLTSEARRLFKQVVEEYELTPAELKILQASCEAWDRAKAARERIEAEGMTVKDRFDQDKPHPLLTAERDARAQFFNGLKQLGLEGAADEMKRGPGRPTYYESMKKGANYG